MAELPALREGVRASLPELAEIRNADLRDRVVEAWALALAESEFARIEEIPPTGVPGSPAMRRGTQADHLRGVARMAVALADGLEEVLGPLGVDRDELIAAALCHDVGKPFEFGPRNLARWRANPAAAGNPSIRHPVYGVHLALLAGLPEAIVHVVGAHSMLAEGSFVAPSLANVIVQYADIAFWKILERAGLLEPQSTS
ncbi:MAG TPA: HD domain-containing protein [Thermomicrobiales bacterium]|jgi:putative nucleotidyltransferase with HDIG domain